MVNHICQGLQKLTNKSTENEFMYLQEEIGGWSIKCCAEQQATTIFVIVIQLYSHL